MERLKVALIQQAMAESKEASIKASVEGIEEAAAKGAQLILLAELHTGYYFCQHEDMGYFSWAETIPGPTTEYFGELARKFNCVLVISLFEKRAPGIYHNTAVVLERDGKIAGKYRKMHIPDDPGYYEKYYFTPGDLGFEPIKTSVGSLGVLVCWDQWFPEAARLMALKGANILLYPTAIGWVPQDEPEIQAQQREAWITIQRAHSIANGLPVVVCNRVGYERLKPEDEGINFWGSSFVTNAQGHILAEASPQDKTVVITEIDFSYTDKIRCAWPYLRDRRIDAYDKLLKRYID